MSVFEKPFFSQAIITFRNLVPLGSPTHPLSKTWGEYFITNFPQ